MCSTTWRLILLVFVLFLSACLPGRKPAYLVGLYTLDYTAAPAPAAPLDQPVGINRFSVAQSYNSAAMIFKPEAYRVAVHTYSKWRTNPGDMVTDFLLRDFRSSGLFRTVFSYHDAERTRLAVEGGVEEFLQSKENDGWKAVLGLHITLLDLNQAEITKKVVFQKRYRAVQPIPDESAQAFASGMSAAMASVSGEIIKDVYGGVKAVGQ